MSCATFGLLPWRPRSQHDLASKLCLAQNFVIWSQILQLLLTNNFYVSNTYSGSITRFRPALVIYCLLQAVRNTLDFSLKYDWPYNISKLYCFHPILWLQCMFYVQVLPDEVCDGCRWYNDSGVSRHLYMWPCSMCRFYETKSVMVAAGITTLVCLAISVFAIQTKVEKQPLNFQCITTPNSNITTPNSDKCFKQTFYIPACLSNSTAMEIIWINLYFQKSI